jgi:hypothetical protein
MSQHLSCIAKYLLPICDIVGHVGLFVLLTVVFHALLEVQSMKQKESLPQQAPYLGASVNR